MDPNIWNEPINVGAVEGDVKADPPAETPSEEVVPADKAETFENTDVETTEKPASETEKPAEQTQDEATDETSGETPEEPGLKRKARALYMEVQKMGGEDVVREAADLFSAIQSPELDSQAKLQKLYQSAPRAFEGLKKELFFQYWDNPAQQDALFQERFGANAAQIEQALKGTVAPSSETTADEEIDDTYLPDAVKAKLAKVEELEKQVKDLTPLKEQVSSFADQKQKDEKAEIDKLGQEFIVEAMSPVVQMMREAGLESKPDDPPEEKQAKDMIWDTIVDQVQRQLLLSPENKPLADDVQVFISKKDRASAWGKMRMAQARAEIAASRIIPVLTAGRQKQRESQTSVLNKEKPPMIQGGQASFGNVTPPQLNGRATWSDPDESQRWKDIAAGLGG